MIEGTRTEEEKEYCATQTLNRCFAIIIVFSGCFVSDQNIIVFVRSLYIACVERFVSHTI